MVKEETTILVVEDEPAVAALIVFTLEAAGWTGYVADRVAAASDWLENKTPHLVLLDYMLPDGTGLRFLSDIRNKRDIFRFPVMMLTARSIQEDKLACIAAGANDYMTKPFSPGELRARVCALLAG